MLLSKQDTEFFIDMGTFDNIIAEITSENNLNSSPEYCNGYSSAIEHFIFYFKKQHSLVIKYKITRFFRRMRKRGVCYFAHETNPCKWTKVDNRALSDAMCTVLYLVYSDMCLLDMSKRCEYYEGYHQAVIDIAAYCGLKEIG